MVNLISPVLYRSISIFFCRSNHIKRAQDFHNSLRNTDAINSQPSCFSYDGWISVHCRANNNNNVEFLVELLIMIRGWLLCQSLETCFGTLPHKSGQSRYIQSLSLLSKSLSGGCILQLDISRIQLRTSHPWVYQLHSFVLFGCSS